MWICVWYQVIYCRIIKFIRSVSIIWFIMESQLLFLDSLFTRLSPSPQSSHSICECRDIERVVLLSTQYLSSLQRRFEIKISLLFMLYRHNFTIAFAPYCPCQKAACRKCRSETYSGYFYAIGLDLFLLKIVRSTVVFCYLCCLPMPLLL